MERFDLRGIHLADAFPGRDQQVPDVEWITYAGARDWCALTQNPQILFVDAEREAIEASGTRVFALASANLTKEGQGLVFGRHWLSIQRRAGRGGACFWRLYPDRIARDIP